jgi:hypothetical protein
MRLVSVTVLSCVALALLASAESPEFVSLVRLVADPGEFDGRRVRVAGFMSLEFEGDALYISREDDDRDLTKNAVWLELATRRPTFDRGYALVEGTFRGSRTGHMGLFSGALEDVGPIVRWPPKRASGPE